MPSLRDGGGTKPYEDGRHYDVQAGGCKRGCGTMICRLVSVKRVAVME